METDLWSSKDAPKPSDAAPEAERGASATAEQVAEQLSGSVADPSAPAAAGGVEGEVARLEQELTAARAAAFSGMATLAETGAVLEFLRASFACRTQADLAARISQALDGLGLTCEVRVRSSDRFSYWSCGRPLARERERAVDALAEMERVFQFGGGLCLNYPRVTIVAMSSKLSKDTDWAGRVRDHLATVAEGAAARLAALDEMAERARRGLRLADAVTALTAAMETLEATQTRNRRRAAEIDEAYLEELIGAFVHLGLTEVQEEELAEMARRAHVGLSELREMDWKIGEQLKALTVQLAELAKEESADESVPA